MVCRRAAGRGDVWQNAGAARRRHREGEQGKRETDGGVCREAGAFIRPAPGGAGDRGLRRGAFAGKGNSGVKIPGSLRGETAGALEVMVYRASVR
jgi:hypothetical protein